MLIPPPLVPPRDVGMVLPRDLVKTSAGIFILSDGVLRLSVHILPLEPLAD